MSNSVLPLPAPRLGSRKSFAETLHLRRTTREISGKPVSMQLLSNALFAACGVNRMRGPFGLRGVTAASASNSQEVDVYVALRQGAFRFERDEHKLGLVTEEDIRELAFTPRQPPLSRNAPVQLVYVADIDKLEHTSGFMEPGLRDPEVQKSYYHVDTGIMAANVYLFAAAHGLACWFHNCDKPALAEKLSLKDTQRVLFAQTIGHSADRR